MSVREHKSQHDSIDELPLVTNSATVAEVTRMDRNRQAKIRERITEWVEEYELDDRYSTATPDPENWDALGNALAQDGHPELARKLSALVDRYHRPKPMLVRVRLETDPDLDFVAGQYVGFSYEGIPRAYSIASSPNRDDVELCIRRVPGGRLSPRICDDLRPGDRATIRGPYGELVLQDPSHRDLVFLATGTGVAPFKSMIDYLFEEGLDEHEGAKRDVWLFVGAAWEDDLPYRDQFRELTARRENFHFVPTLSREPYLTGWKKETDYVQHALLKHVDPAAVTAPLGAELEAWIRRNPGSDVEARLDPAAMEVYACGINAMVYSLVTAVRKLGIPEEYIESEGYG